MEKQVVRRCMTKKGQDAIKRNMIFFMVLSHAGLVYESSGVGAYA